MRKFLLFFLSLIVCTKIISQEIDNDTLSIMNFDSYEEVVRIFPAEPPSEINLIGSFGGVSIDLLNNVKVRINRDSLLLGLEQGMQVSHGDQVIIKKNICEKIEIINNDGIVVRTITGLLGLMPEEIEPFLRNASEARVSGFNQRISFNGKDIPVGLNFRLE